MIVKSKDTQYGALGKANHLLIFRVMLSQAGALYTNEMMIHQSKNSCKYEKIHKNGSCALEVLTVVKN